MKKMDSEISNVNFVEKCRICLNAEHEMNPFFDPVYEVQVENETIFISLAEVFKSLSNVEVR